MIQNKFLHVGIDIIYVFRQQSDIYSYLTIKERWKTKKQCSEFWAVTKRWNAKESI